MPLALYNFLKDFSGPLATTLAALVAAGVTYSFQRRAIVTSERKLQLELFDRRYKQFLQVKNLIVSVMNATTFTDEQLRHQREIYISLAEGRFLFSTSVADFIQEAEIACEDHVRIVTRIDAGAYDNSEVQALIKKRTDSSHRLRLLRERLFPVFERDLKIIRQ